MSTEKNKPVKPVKIPAKTGDIKDLFPNGFETAEMVAVDHPYINKGEKFKTGKAHVAKLTERGWAKLATAVVLLFCVAFVGQAQSVSLNFYNQQYGSAYASDTVTNTGTGVLECSAISGGGTTTTIVAKVLEISGTTGGTITLQGCIVCDGNDWKALNQPNSATALATHTATDVASNTYHWWLTGSPFRQYRISYTGTGTMSARIFGYLAKK